ncbi:hypothetical protein [Enterococcus sp. LJL51]|uniref:hypothetical protein n=1 Tax=Enterococcus sp. LJL51 TaxID=3416656 RepID=UPI003CE8646B
MSNENFNVTTKYNEKINLLYEDLSCIAYCKVVDFRDEVLWVDLSYVESRLTKKNVKLSSKQNTELFKRINYMTIKKMNKQVYEESLGFIEEPPYDLKSPLLEME